MPTATIPITFHVRSDWHEAGARIGFLSERLREALRRGTEDAASILEGEAVEAIPKKTRRTASAIGRSEVEPTASGWQAFVGTSDRVAIILEDGSRAHAIISANGVLRFVGADGRVLYRKRVWHPGTPPYLWMNRAFLLTEPRAINAYEREVDQALGEVLGVGR